MQMQPVTAPAAVYIVMENGDNDTTPDRLEDSETAMIPRHGNNESSSTVALRRATSTKSGHTKGPVVGVCGEVDSGRGGDATIRKLLALTVCLRRITLDRHQSSVSNELGNPVREPWKTREQSIAVPRAMW